MLGVSQSSLGKAVDLTFQQIHRYERGDDRVGASRLWTLACALDVPVSFFFQKMETSGRDVRRVRRRRLDHPDIIALVKAYRSIADRRQQRAILQLIKALGEETPKLAIEGPRAGRSRIPSRRPAVAPN
jgi:transcriptional regulator with XRE-family HTH domain